MPAGSELWVGVVADGWGGEALVEVLGEALPEVLKGAQDGCELAERVSSQVVVVDGVDVGGCPYGFVKRLWVVLVLGVAGRGCRS